MESNKTINFAVKDAKRFVLAFLLLGKDGKTTCTFMTIGSACTISVSIYILMKIHDKHVDLR